MEQEFHQSAYGTPTTVVIDGNLINDETVFWVGQSRCAAQVTTNGVAIIENPSLNGHAEVIEWFGSIESFEEWWNVHEPKIEPQKSNSWFNRLLSTFF